jgi:hypothetical protein
MARKNLFKSESAAAIAIAAVLLLGLAFTAISVVKLNYAPEWKIDAERDYSYETWSSMEEVKTRADIFTQVMNSDINYPYGLSATVPFKMGGGDVPVFEPSKSNSKLAVNTENCTMNITFRTHSFNENCGGVTYYSENRQYPNQVFRYENGALILDQDSNSQMKRNPSFNIQKNMSNYNYTVTINAINLTGKPESISSSTLTALRLTGCSTDHVLNSDVYTEAEGDISSFNLNISTHYTEAWTTYLNNTAKDAGLVYKTDYTLESIPNDHVCISFLPTGNNYSIYVNKTVLCAELGPGNDINYTNFGSGEETETSGGDGGSEIGPTHGNRIILNKNGIGGVISSGTYIQFKNHGKWDYIEIDSKKKNLGKDQTIKLVINGNQTSGTADMNSNSISNFNFDAEVYIDDNFAYKGKITGIWIEDYSDYESTLTYKLPSYLSSTQLKVDGENLIDWLPYNDSAINLYNIGPSSTNNEFLRIYFNSGYTYIDCSADYEIINS